MFYFENVMIFQPPYMMLTNTLLKKLSLSIVSTVCTYNWTIGFLKWTQMWISQIGLDPSISLTSLPKTNIEL